MSYPNHQPPLGGTGFWPRARLTSCLPKFFYPRRWTEAMYGMSLSDERDSYHIPRGHQPGDLPPVRCRQVEGPQGTLAHPCYPTSPGAPCFLATPSLTPLPFSVQNVILRKKLGRFCHFASIFTPPQTVLKVTFQPFESAIFALSLYSVRFPPDTRFSASCLWYTASLYGM